MAPNLNSALNPSQPWPLNFEHQEKKLDLNWLSDNFQTQNISKQTTAKQLDVDNYLAHF